MNKGDESDYRDKFDQDMYQELLDEELKGLNESLTVAGKVTQETSKSGVTYAMQTFDGGAIVISGLRSEQVYEKTVAGAKMSVGELVAAKNGGTAEVASKLTAVYQHMVAFYVPPADSDEKVRLIGAERVLSAVELPED